MISITDVPVCINIFGSLTSQTSFWSQLLCAVCQQNVASTECVCKIVQAANINLIAALNQEQQESEAKLAALRQQHDRLQAELQSQVA